MAGTLKDNTVRIENLLTSISDLPKDRYDDGYSDGYNIGHTEGVKDGYAEGYNDGLDYKPPTIYEKDVNFYDYDGTLLYSFTKEEFIALTDLPELPTQNGLICQEWNWSFETLRNYVAKYGKGNVGATYITDDGATRIYINLSTEAQLEFSVAFSQGFGYGVAIDWGDGTTETITKIGRSNPVHTYDKTGNYIVSLMPSDNEAFTIGYDSSNANILGEYTTTAYQYKRAVVKKVEIGKCVNAFGSYTLQGFPSITSVTLPNNVNHLGHFTLAVGASTVVVPKSVGTMATYSIYGAKGIRNLIRSETPMVVQSSSMQTVVLLEKSYLPEGTTEIQSSAFNSCSSLGDVIIPEGVTSIGSSAFNGCSSLSVIKLPSSITTIKSTAFSGCNNMKVYDFTKHTAVPTLESVDAFNGIQADCIFRVPDALYDEWISATNWSTFAAQIRAI